MVTARDSGTAEVMTETNPPTETPLNAPADDPHDDPQTRIAPEPEEPGEETDD